MSLSLNKNKSLTLRGSSSWLSVLLRLEIWELGAQNLPTNLRLLIGKYAFDSFLLHEEITYSQDIFTNNKPLRNTAMLEIDVFRISSSEAEMNGQYEEELILQDLADRHWWSYT